MTVKELKLNLETFNEDLEVVYSINGEDIYDIDAVGRCTLDNEQICILLI